MARGDSKGLARDVCNSLKQGKACWRCCCRDGRKAACNGGPSCAHCGHTLIFFKLGQKLQKRERRLKQDLRNILAASSIMNI